ncbi:hypothetical protein C8Q73DRAFT_692126 [Cubamyces lactineus]|nr:hypothetical protein C8Q73DRAFT_692126 [Cubamyces lactineus]
MPALNSEILLAAFIVQVPLTGSEAASNAVSLILHPLQISPSRPRPNVKLMSTVSLLAVPILTPSLLPNIGTVR